MGLVNRVVAAGASLPAAQALATQLAAFPQTCLREAASRRSSRRTCRCRRRWPASWPTVAVRWPRCRPVWSAFAPAPAATAPLTSAHLHRPVEEIDGLGRRQAQRRLGRHQPGRPRALRGPGVAAVVEHVVDPGSGPARTGQGRRSPPASSGGVVLRRRSKRTEDDRSASPGPREGSRRPSPPSRCTRPARRTRPARPPGVSPWSTGSARSRRPAGSGPAAGRRASKPNSEITPSMSNSSNGWHIG